MRAWCVAFLAMLRLEILVMLQYRGEMILWALWGVVYPAVAIAMWGAAVEGSADGVAIGDYGPRQFAAYFLCTMIVGHFGTAWDVYEMGYRIKSGDYSTRLVRPVPPVWEHLAANLAFKLITFAVLVPLWVAVAWITRPAFDSSTVHVLVGVVATVLGSAMNFLWGFILALTAFWVTRTDGIAQAWFGGGLFFGGRLAPLAILPALLQDVAAFLPFQWMIWFPCAALMGQWPADRLAAGLLAQLAWLAGGVVVFRWAWPIAVRRYSAVGT